MLVSSRLTASFGRGRLSGARHFDGHAKPGRGRPGRRRCTERPLGAGKSQRDRGWDGYLSGCRRPLAGHPGATEGPATTWRAPCRSSPIGVTHRSLPSLWPGRRWALLKRKADKPRLIPFVCEKCGRLILQTLHCAQVWCRECRRWVSAGEHETSKDKTARRKRRKAGRVTPNIACEDIMSIGGAVNYGKIGQNSTAEHRTGKRD